mmetsp:Transcript_19057/g.45138  ORF Transcript_19057/g.45138 Transcript_19057/m.45138 type:complete len:139 (+) Transcript_19057:2238-2654(+)
MLHHHTGHGLNGDDHSLVIGSDLNANGVDSTARMLDRNALEVNALHLLLGTRIVKRETNQALHECDGILVVGVGARRGLLAHRTRIRESNHAWVEAIGVAIEDDVDAAAAGGGNRRILVAEIDADDGHCWLLLLRIID